jgi:hypothetical protein
MNTLILTALLSLAVSAQRSIVTPYLQVDGYSAKTWTSNPAGGCTSTYDIMNRAFPNGLFSYSNNQADINQWTGQMKYDAVQMVAARNGYLVLARYISRSFNLVVPRLRAHVLNS